jgi:hypothetical protein
MEPNFLHMIRDSREAWGQISKLPSRSDSDCRVACRTKSQEAGAIQEFLVKPQADRV